MSTVPAERPQGPLSFTFATQAVRIHLDEQGEPWFCAPDVCDVLGYPNNRDAIARHCLAKGVVKRDTLTAKGQQSLTFINEGNLFRLILKSRKPQALAFEQVVCDEILPQIRKTGRYEAPRPMAEEPVSPQQFQQLSWAVSTVGGCYHMSQAAQWACWKLLRDRFGLTTGARQLPARHYDAALILLEQARDAATRYKQRVIETERKHFRARFAQLPPELQTLAVEFGPELTP